MKYLTALLDLVDDQLQGPSDTLFTKLYLHKFHGERLTIIKDTQ